MNTIEKIKKLLKLGNSDNKFEADRALAAAMKLAAGAGIAIEDVEKEDSHKESHIAEEIFHEGKTHKAWEIELAIQLAEPLGGMILSSSNGKMRFIGKTDKIEIFLWLYHTSKRELKILYAVEKAKYYQMPGTKLSAAYHEKSWYMGAVCKIAEMAKEIFKTTTTDKEQQQYALVLRDNKKDVALYLANNYSNLKESRTRKIKLDTAAYWNGYHKAEQIRFNKEIQ